MEHISEIIDNILTEWAYQVNDGMPDVNNPLHMAQLEHSLYDLEFPPQFIVEFMGNLREADKTPLSDKDKEKVKKLGLVWKRVGYGKEDEKGITHKNVDGKLVAVGDEKGHEKEPEKEKEKEPEDKEATKDFFKSKYEKDAEKDDEKEDTGQNLTTQKIQQNASDIFDDKVSGKGGGTTSLQEEIAGISRKLAIEYPEDTPEQHQERITQFIKDNYGDTKYGSKDQTALIKKSASGPETIRKIKENDSMKFNDNQPEGFPMQVTFTEGGTTGVRNELEEKLKEAKRNGDTEAISHYETELKYFIKHATSETGVEGDGDTGMMYADTDGRTRMIYVSNKQGLKDPHANATVKSASEAIKSSIEPGANAEALTSMLDESVKGGIDANGDMVKSNRVDIDTSIEELNKAPLTKIATQATTGQAEFVDETSRKYIDECKKNKQVLEYLDKQDPKLDKDNDEHIVRAVMATAGSGEADGLNDSTKQAPNKLLLKMTRATASIREKMQKLIPPKSPEEAAEIVANQKNQKGKPLMGGNMSPEDCLSIYNNKALEKLEQNAQTRKDAMQKSHEEMYNSMAELDVAHYMEQGMSSDEALEKYKNEAGPNEQTYTKSFMKRMHWDRYIDGIDDDKKMIEIGDKSYSPKDFRDCLGELTDWDGEGDLKEHIKKNMRVTPGSMKLSFVSKGKTIEIGDDTWRTAGDLSKIAGGLGKDMRNCLENS